jgi:hypothetical protein
MSKVLIVVEASGKEIADSPTTVRMVSAPPATYLVQFGFQGSDICFDRLWSFPSAPAIARLGRPRARFIRLLLVLPDKSAGS